MSMPHVVSVRAKVFIPRGPWFEPDMRSHYSWQKLFIVNSMVLCPNKTHLLISIVVLVIHAIGCQVYEKVLVKMPDGSRVVAGIG